MIEKPFILAGKKLSTRLVFPPLATESSDGGKPNEKITQHYCAIAANPNVGMIITEHSYVDPQGKADPHQISFADDSVIDAQKAMVKSIRNVRPDICLLAQINHAGANTRKLYTGMDLVSASDIKWTRDQARALTVDEIHDLEQKYIAAALRVQEAGYDGVEIHCAHAYLLNQFYSPITNHRDDEYGPQTITNRLRFTLEIIRGIKAKANKNFIVSVRLGGCDYKEGGSTIGGSAGAAVEGNRTLELKGTFGTGDFQNVTFTRFDEINIAQEGASATIYALTDSPALTKTGAGTLTLGADAAGAETILDGTTEGITISEGSLNLSGAGGSHMKGTWNIASGSRLTGVSGTVTVGEGGLDGLTIALGTENIGQDTQASGAVISNGSGTGSDPNLSIEGEGLTLDLSNDAVVNLLLDHKTDDSSSYLTLTSGTLTVGDLGDIAFTTDLLSNYGIRVTGTDGGSLVLSGAATGLYRVQEEGGNAHEVNSYQTLSGYAGVVIGGGQTDGQPGRSPGRIRRTGS